MPNIMIGYCGLDCAHCGAYQATQTNDDALRAKTAAEWSAMYGADIKPEDINCDGCRTPGIKFSYCEHGCELRKCGRERQVDTCAACGDYACEKLEAFFAMAPDARTALEALRAEM